MQCSACGHSNVVGARFCAQCGVQRPNFQLVDDPSSPTGWAEVYESTPSTPPPPQIQTSPPPVAAAVAKSKSNAWAWVVVAVVAFGGWKVYQAKDGSDDFARAPTEDFAHFVSVEGQNLVVHYDFTYQGSQWKSDVTVPREAYDHYRGLDRSQYISGDRFDYSQFISEPHDDEFFKTLANSFLDAVRENGLTEEEAVGMALAFVQSLPYALDQETTLYDEYPRFPLETLVDAASDCEDTTILFVSLVHAMGYGSAVLLLPDAQHAAAGVRVNPGFAGTYFEKDGIRYAYTETTGDGWAIGQMPPEWANEKAYIQPVYVTVDPDAVPAPTISRAEPPPPAAPPPSAPPAYSPQPTYSPPPTYNPQPSRHFIAQDQLIAIPAGTFYWQTFTVTGTVQVDYSFANVDYSTENVGIILHSDLQTYRSGQSVNAWGYHSNVASVTESVTLTAQTYDFVFYCLNDVYDCDLEYSLSSWY